MFIFLNKNGIFVDIYEHYKQLKLKFYVVAE